MTPMRPKAKRSRFGFEIIWRTCHQYL